MVTASMTNSADDLCTPWLVARVRGIHALLLRQQVETELLVAPQTAPRWTQTLEKIASYVDSEVRNTLTADEMALLDAPWGAFADSDIQAAAWLIEQLGVGLWTLQRLEELDPSAPVQAPTIEGALPLFPSAESLTAVPRSRADVVAAQRVHLLWRWRIEAEVGHRNGATTPGGKAFAVFVGAGAARAPATIPTGEVEGGLDFLVDGFGVQSLSVSRIQELRALLHERTIAFEALIAGGVR